MPGLQNLHTQRIYLQKYKIFSWYSSDKQKHSNSNYENIASDKDFDKNAL